MADQLRTRFELHFPDYIARRSSVFILGCGAIGSWTALALQKLGLKIFILWDDDCVAVENVGVQSYGNLDIGVNKVTALASAMVIAQGVDKGLHIATARTRLVYRTRELPTCNIYIAAVDNIEARYLLWSKAHRLLYRMNRNAVFIDPRMGLDTFEIHAQIIGKHVLRLQRDYRKEYLATFHKEVTPAPCGFEASPATAITCAGVISSLIRTMLVEEPFPLYQRYNLTECTSYRGTVVDMTARTLPKRTSLQRRMLKEAV